ncbi:MAG: hypothetical protein JSV88_20885 [Candidatus Aminicenantes bacterium]|nr:MAG: hypothetical protein JSV88_20885 [Candidatus Aminicenantes bacterium]
MKKFNVLSALVMVLGAVFCLTSVLPAAWVGNDIPPGRGSGETDSRIEGFIIDGASFFLRSHADIFLLLNESEVGLKTGFNLEEAHQLIESALDRLIISREKYANALALMKSTAWDETWLQKLKAFDYKGLTAVRQLHPDVMEQVAGFLVVGNVVGLYEQMVDELANMEKILRNMSKNTQKGIPPEMETLRILFQQYSDFMLFGYYTSLVFSEV